MKNLQYYIRKALRENFAIGALNFSNMESLQGIVAAAKQCKSPIIISVSEGAFEYMNDAFVMALAQAAKKSAKGLFLHLDHGKTFAICKKAVDLGFDSVMIDGSSLSFAENVKLTKKVCLYAHAHQVLVEGELGQIKGIEDTVSATDSHFTDPEAAKTFVTETGIDTLAVAIGTSHGAYKYTGKQTLRFDILSEIERELPAFPLVLHGASTVSQDLVKSINNYGGKLDHANGIPESLLQEAIQKHNVIKINTDTDLRLAMTSETRKILQEHPGEIDPRKYLGAGRNMITEIASNKIKNVFFSENKL